MDRIVFHIDVNNAFLSWTALDLLNQGYKYDIRNSYAVVGGDETKRRGVVLAKSNSAKKQGVITGETLYSARKKCPVLKSYPGNYLFYQEMSKKMFELISEYTNEIEISSVDECCMEYTGIKHIYGDPIIFANKLKDEIYSKLGFSVNIGIGNNKLCAKMASDFKKPNLVHTLFDNEIEEKMYKLDIGDLFGIGRKTEPKLKSIGINTIGDLARSKEEDLIKYFKNQTLRMINLARGIDDSPVVIEKADPTSISNTFTLLNDANSKTVLYRELELISNNLGRSIRSQNKYCLVVAVILKDSFFKSRTHQKKLINATNLTSEIYNLSKKLLDEMWDEETPIRLIGIRLDGLTDTSKYQVSLFDSKDGEDNLKYLDQAMDKMKEKYGDTIINSASLNDKILED